MTNKEIMDIAMQQSAYDTNAKVSDFLQDTNVFVKSGVGPLARKYYKEPIACNFVSYGSNVVASVKDEFKEIVETYLSKFEFYHCFETPNMHWLDERMKEKGYRVCFMAEYFLPDMERLKRLECNYVLKVLEQKDFADLYLPMWGNALCADRKELDVLGVGAYDGEKLVGLAACSMKISMPATSVFFSMRMCAEEFLPNSAPLMRNEYAPSGISCSPDTSSSNCF